VINAPINDLQAFANEFVLGVNTIAENLEPLKWRGEFTRWTYAVKFWLAQKAEEFSLRPLYTDADAGAEFMLDLVWWKDGAGGGAALACECEWGNARYSGKTPQLVADDFEKLLCFKAPIKLLIFDSYSEHEIQRKVILKLEDYLQNYGDHRINERYLVVDMSRKPAAWLSNGDSDGFNPTLALQPFALGLE